MGDQSFLEDVGVSAMLWHIAVILILAWVLVFLSRRVIRVTRNYMNARADSAEDTRRIETLARVFRYIATVVIFLLACMLILKEIGISIVPILGAAGVVGLAIGFGAQNLVKDYFTGFFILLENQIRQGDVVEVCGKTGTVEDITLRYVCLRDNEGSVHYVPNGLITTVSNKSRTYAFALIDFGIAYREKLDDVLEVVREVGKALRTDPITGPKILEDIEIQGVQDWAGSALILRCRFKTVALEQWSVRRAFLGKLKQAFDIHGIEIPYPHMTLYAGQDKIGNAPAFHLLNRVVDK